MPGTLADPVSGPAARGWEPIGPDDPRRPDTINSVPIRTPGVITRCGLPAVSSGSIGSALQRGDSVTGPTEESAVATQWPTGPGLAAVLEIAADQARPPLWSSAARRRWGTGVCYSGSTPRICLATRDGNGPSWWRAIQRGPCHDPARWCWSRGLHCWRRIGCRGSNRCSRGDLSPGDLLAPAKDDPRLVPGYTASGDAQVDETAAEIGLGRRWVMSAWGRAQSAQRWHDGDLVPAARRSTRRVTAATAVSSCRWPGRWGAMFGVCGNELCP